MSKGLSVVTPVDGSVYVERPYSSPDEIALALDAATAAQNAWAATSLADRAKLCTAAVDAFVAKPDSHVEELAWQMGRPIRYGKGEVGGFEERARHMIDIAETALADVSIADKPGFSRWIKRVPLGVVFTVAPWNYPYLTSVNSIIPALMAGNAVILKHAAQTPLCAERLFDAFESAGAPKGLFQFLHLTHDQAAKVVASPQIAFVAFTGSVPGGTAMERAAAGHFKGIGLELGGKDPAYVRADANLDHAVENVADGVFFNSGQSCCGIERIYVHADVYDRFVDGIAELTRQYVLGSPLDHATTLGPMVRTSAADFVREQTAEAVTAGAKALIDASGFSADEEGTPYLAPQVLVDVDHAMRVMSEESFGPVVGIMKVRSDDEAITLMNDSEFGLTASVWTEDADAAVRIGNQVETGTWFMNRCDYLDPALAWTGVKQSGHGCTLSSVGYEQLTRPKSYHLRTAL
ncbi:MAG: aldehyde dehydrogenase family protein [Hyphomicrobiaceae bacterium]